MVQKGTLEDKVIQEGKVFAVIGYLSILSLLSLSIKRDNKFTLFHAKQGLVLFIVEAAALIIFVIPILGQIVLALTVLVCGLLSLIGIVQALQGKYWRMPIVANIADKISI